MPYQRNPHITGRDELLDQLYVRVSERKPKQYNHRVALYGLGGVGKTQVAIEYAYRNESIYSGIYWISAVDEAALLSGFLEIATETKCVPSVENLKLTEVAKRVLRWLRKRPSWLMIYDNLDDITVVKNYLPDMTSEGHTLITTRNPNAISIPAEGLEVDVLDVQGAMELLCIRSEIVALDAVKAEAIKIVTELGFLPLAIEQAAAYIREASKDIFTFFETYRANRTQIHQRIPHGNWDYSSSVATTWLLAFSVIAKKNIGAAKLLRLFAFLNPDLILIDFLQAGLDGLDHELQKVVRSPLVFQAALFLLEQFSLIRRWKDGITIHRLVQTVIKDNMTEAEKQEQWDSAIGLCYTAFPNPATENRMTCRRYQEQVMVPLASQNWENSSRFGEILIRVGQFLDVDGKDKEAEAMCLKSVRIFSALRGETHPDTLNAIHHLQSVYAHLGKFKNAGKLGKQNLENRKRILGEEHLETLRSMHTLASVYERQGLYTDAVELYQRCSDLRLKVLGREHPDTLGSYRNLGWVYMRLGRFIEATKLLEQCSEASTRVLGEEHPDTLTGVNHLATTYRLQGRLSEALKLQKQSLDIKIRVLGEEHPNVVDSMGNLALTYQSQGRLSDATKLQEQCLKNEIQIRGEDHPETLNAMTNLAITYRKQGRLEDAAKLEEKSLEAKKRVLGEEHDFTLESVSNLAAVYSEQGRFVEAVEMEEKNLATHKRVLGVDHPYTLDCVRNLEAIYSKRSQSVMGDTVDGPKRQEDGGTCVLVSAMEKDIVAEYC